MNTLKSINFPCVMLEKVEGESVSEKHLTKFILVHSQKEIDEKAKFFNHPVLCHYYSVVNEAKRLSNLNQTTGGAPIKSENYASKNNTTTRKTRL